MAEEFKIALNAGHGKYTAGKCCLKSIDANETSEWWLNARICEKVQAKLKAYKGYKLIRLDDTTGETDVKLRKRTDKANEFDANIYIAVHHNAGIKGGKGGGIVVYVYTRASKASKEWQKAMYDALIEKTGLKGNRATPLNSANFHEVRESKMPAVLLELGFMDSVVDTPIILTDKYAEQCADAIVEVIVEKGKLAKKTNKEEAPKNESNSTDGYKGKLPELPDRGYFKEGDEGEQVKLLQEFLNWCINAGLEPDGDFGPLTKEAVEKFQDKYGLDPDGKFGKKSLAKAKYLCAPDKTVEQLAKEVIRGKWGNGANRKKRLTEAGYNYAEVQAEVDKLMKK